MAAPSAIISTADGSAAAVNRATGAIVYVTPGNQMTLALQSSTGVISGSLQFSSDYGPLNFVVPWPTSTFSFTFPMPLTPCVLNLVSEVTDGQNNYSASYTLNNFMKQNTSAVRAVVTTLQAYGGTGTGTLTETSNGAISAADGVTLVLGDMVFIQEGTTNLTAAKDAGPWIVTALGGASAKWTLVRPPMWQNGQAIVPGAVFEVGGEGTTYAGTSWKSFAATGKVVGTDAPVFWPRAIYGSTALVAGTFTISQAVKSATTSTVVLVRSVANTSTATTGGYHPTVAGATGFTQGVIGTGSVVIQATVAAGTINANDVSTLNWALLNW